MKEIFKLIATLTSVALLCSGILAYVYVVTKSPIAATAAAGKLAAVSAVMPEGCDAPKAVERDGISYYEATRDGKIAAYAFEGFSRNGYGGGVSLMVGISASGELIDFEVLQASETPGLGSKIGEEAFRAPLRGRAVDGTWKVKKDGGDIDAVTAATISSRACLECIGNALGKFRKVCPR